MRPLFHEYAIKLNLAQEGVSDSILAFAKTHGLTSRTATVPYSYQEEFLKGPQGLTFIYAPDRTIIGATIPVFTYNNADGYYWSVTDIFDHGHPFSMEVTEKILAHRPVDFDLLTTHVSHVEAPLVTTAVTARGERRKSVETRIEEIDGVDMIEASYGREYIRSSSYPIWLYGLLVRYKGVPFRLLYKRMPAWHWNHLAIGSSPLLESVWYSITSLPGTEELAEELGDAIQRYYDEVIFVKPEPEPEVIETEPEPVPEQHPPVDHVHDPADLEPQPMGVFENPPLPKKQGFIAWFKSIFN